MSTMHLSREHFATIAASLVRFACHGNMGHRKLEEGEFSPYQRTDRTGERYVNSETSDALSSSLCRRLQVCSETMRPLYSEAEPVVHALVFDWHRINTNAFTIRYPRESKPHLEEVARLVSGDKMVGLVPLIKLLECLQYNCDEDENMPETFRPAYATLGEVVDLLKSVVVHNITEYETAPWSLPEFTNH